MSSAETGVPRYDHVFLIVEEDHSLGQIIGNTNAPVINQLATTYGLATAYYGVTHPSEPNYVALIGGSFFSIQDDGPYRTNRVDAPSLATQVEAAQLSWRSYQQSLPHAGFTGTTSTLYAAKHNPFLNFASVQDDPAEMQKSVPIEQLNVDPRAAPSPTLVSWCPISAKTCTAPPAAPTTRPTSRRLTRNSVSWCRASRPARPGAQARTRSS